MTKKIPEENDLPSLEELGRKIEKAKQEAAEPEAEKSTSGKALEVGIDLVAGVIGGSFIGYYLDKWLGTKGVFFIICFFLGIAGAVRNILRSIKAAEKSDENGSNQ
jgi:ATP synthase protein I